MGRFCTIARCINSFGARLHSLIDPDGSCFTNPKPCFSCQFNLRTNSETHQNRIRSYLLRSGLNLSNPPILASQGLDSLRCEDLYPFLLQMLAEDSCKVLIKERQNLRGQLNDRHFLTQLDK